MIKTVIADITLTNLKTLMPKGMAREAWATDETLRSRNVALYRRYMDGDFDASMTVDMKAALRVTRDSEFAANHCELVVSAMTDRLAVAAIEGETDAASAWLSDLMTFNRFDGFQMDVTESCIVDGDTYVLVDFDNESSQVRWTHEPAFDGVEGMIIIPRSNNDRTVVAAMKVWQETWQNYADTTRVNVYFPDRIMRYYSGAHMKGFLPYQDAEAGILAEELWTDRRGQPIGVPVVHFANRRRGRGGFGRSELSSMVELQDVLNRTLHSMAMTSELAGFPIRHVIGYKTDAALTPGQIVQVFPQDNSGNFKMGNETEIRHLSAVRFGQWESAELTPLLEMYAKIEQQIARTTNTPDLGTVGDNASGEARKQAEIGLLGKIARFQTKIGNAWEDVATLSARVASAFGAPSVTVPERALWRTAWKSSKLRNEAEVIEQAGQLRDLVGLAESLRLIGDVYGWDEAKVQQVLAEREAETDTLAAKIMAQAPAYRSTENVVMAAPPVEAPALVAENG
jgi:hypothetical protein